MASFIQKYFDKTAPHALKRSYPAIAGLHLNEMPRDIPLELRERIVGRLQKTTLHRYPEPYAESLAKKLAHWYGCNEDQLLVGPGSSAFIRLLLTYFGLHIAGKLVITRPSFAYYEQFCLAFGVEYDTWELDDDFQYNPDALAGLPEYSVVCLTSPNNPTGNLLSLDQAEALLRQHPLSLFIVDEAYGEFVEESMLPLLRKYHNLLILRTLSKAFSAAGIRCGALMGEPVLVKAISGLQTPWQLPNFTIEAAHAIVDYSRETNWIKQRVGEVIREREWLYQQCCSLAGTAYHIYPSHANFLLIRARDARAHRRLLTACANYLIRVSDQDNLPRLSGCVRVTVGTPEENQLFVKAFREATKTAYNG